MILKQMYTMCPYHAEQPPPQDEDLSERTTIPYIYIENLPETKRGQSETIDRLRRRTI